MTSVPPPSQPSSSLPPHPEVPAGIVPGPPPPAAGGTGSLGPVPAWAPLAAMFAGFVVATLAYVMIAAGIEAGGGNVTTGGPPGLVISATLIQDVALIVAAVMFAGMWARGLTPASFGLRRVPLARAAGWTVLAFVMFWILTGIYISLVGQPDQQELTRDLRDEESLSALIGYGVLLAFIAPLAEELFFRGFVFGVLREKIGPAWGALATGIVFGLVHVAGSPIETVGVLIILGVLLCVVYQQTGSLLPCIGLHAVNNAISFSATKSVPWPEAVLIVLACTGAAVAVAAAFTQRPISLSRA
ncbi:MAG: protease family protein [Solirubrobacteraceae bacterium]|nr:protease family protein [Solirubrobacteraceae bacterium]